MALTVDDLVKIFTGMDLGAEKIQANFNKLLQENQDQDSTIATIFPKHKMWLGKCGETYDQRNWDDLDEGVYDVGWWSADQAPDHSYGDPAVNTELQAKIPGNWGHLFVFGTSNDHGMTGLCAQLAFASGTNEGGIYLRDNVGGHGWNNWHHLCK